MGGGLKDLKVSKLYSYIFVNKMFYHKGLSAVSYRSLHCHNKNLLCKSVSLKLQSLRFQARLILVTTVITVITERHESTEEIKELTGKCS